MNDSFEDILSDFIEKEHGCINAATTTFRCGGRGRMDEAVMIGSGADEL